MADRIKILRLQYNLVEPTNHRLLDELAEFDDLEVRAICPRWGIESGSKRVLRVSRPDLTVGLTAMTFNYSLKFYLTRFGALMRNFRPDIIDVHEEPWSLTAYQALVYRKMFSPDSKVLIYSAQNIDKHYPPPFSMIHRMMNSEASAGYVCSEGVRDVMRLKGFNGRIDIVPLGLDPELFRYRKRNAELRDGLLHAGFVGRVDEEKGVFTLLKAITLSGPRVRLKIVGPGPALEQAKKKAKQMSIDSRVEFTGGVSHSRVVEIMDGLDVLVVPSETTPRWKEQFGRVVVEAMGRGVPVIGSDSGSLPEIIGDAGLVFPEKNEVRLADCISRLLENPVHIEEMSELGLERVMRLFTFKRAAEMMRDLYHSMMDEKNAG